MKQCKTILSQVCFFFVLIACHKETVHDTVYNNGVAIKLPHVWKTPVLATSNTAGAVLETPIIYDQYKVVLGAVKDSYSSLVSLNSETGDILWQWNDLIGKDYLLITKLGMYISSNRVFFTSAGRTYCVDLGNGNTFWKYALTDRSRPDVNSGIDDLYFTVGSPPIRTANDNIYLGSMLSSSPDQLLLTPEYTQVDTIYSAGSITSLLPFKQNGNTYLAFGIENPWKNGTTGKGFSELNVFNLSTRTYEFKKLAININHETQTVSDLIYQSSNLYFHSSNYIHCHDAITGQQKWRTYLGSFSAWGGILLADDKIFKACENGRLYCLDANTGNFNWGVPNTTTCSRMSYLNGVIYYIGGGDGKLYAVDTSNGKTLWKMSSPDLDIDDLGYFHNNCTVVPGQNGEKGKVIVSTGYNAYAYEAAR